MKIECIDLIHFLLPLVAPFETSFGRQTERNSLLVTIYADGLRGWGECVATAEPGYSYETNGTASHVLRDFLIPAILGQDIAAVADLRARFRPVRGHPMAKASLEMAFWDLLGQEEGKSLAQMWGGVRPTVEVGVSIGIQPSTEALIRRITAYLDEGYRRIKIKIKPGYDLEVVRAVRAAFPAILLQVDANSAYRLEDMPIFEAMDDLDLLMIEQPLAEDDIFNHAKLQARLQTPICLDESILSADHARWALEMEAARVINIKAGRVGGLSEAIAIHDMCQSANVPVWCGGMLETGIGRASNVALASLPDFRLPGDISASDRYFPEDLIDPPFVLGADGTLPVPTDPGLGVKVVEGRVERATLGRERFGS